MIVGWTPLECAYREGTVNFYQVWRRYTTSSTTTTRRRQRKSLSPRRIRCRTRTRSTQQTSTGAAWSPKGCGLNSWVRSVRGIRASRKGLRGLRQGNVCHQDRAPCLDRGVPGHLDVCCGACGEHLGWVHESVLVCARLPRATAWVDLRSSACALRHGCYLHFRPSPTLCTGGCGHRELRSGATTTAECGCSGVIGGTRPSLRRRRDYGWGRCCPHDGLDVEQGLTQLSGHPSPRLDHRGSQGVRGDGALRVGSERGIWAPYEACG